MKKRIIVGAIDGIVILKILWNLFAPSISAAS